MELKKIKKDAIQSRRPLMPYSLVLILLEMAYSSLLFRNGRLFTANTKLYNFLFTANMERHNLYHSAEMA